MPINRFYTPSLPEYTSQFVEDQTPWDEMIALENLKLDRTDQAMQSADQINTSLAQIIPGARTGPIAEAVKSEYSKAVEDWTKEHMNDSYSAPAIRKLTQINSRWKQDPRVTKIIRDREETPMYLQQRAQMDNRDIDPNVDPETGEIIPLSDDQEFQSFQPILRAQPFEDQLLADLRAVDIEDRQEPVIKTITDEDTGQKIKGITTRSSKIRGDEQLDPALETIADRIEKGTYASAPWVKAMLGPDATRDDIIGFLGGYKKQAYVDDFGDSGFTVLKGEEEEGKVPLNRLSGSNVPLTKEPLGPTNNGIDFGGKGTGPKRGTKSDVRQVGRKEDKLDPTYIQVVSNKDGIIPPQHLTNNSFTIKENIDGKEQSLTPFDNNLLSGGLNQGSEAEAMIYNSLDNNYAQTKAAYKTYYSQYENEDEFKEAGETGSWGRYRTVRDNLDDYIAKFDKSRGYDKPNEDIFKSDLNFTAARNAVIMSGALDQDVDNPFGSGGEDPKSNFINTSADEYTPEQQVWISKIFDNYSGSDRANTVTPMGITMSPDQEEFIENTYIGKTTSANSSIPGKTLKRTLLGARVIPLWYIGKNARKQPDMGKQLSTSEKEKLLTESNDDDTDVRLGTWIDPKTTTWGPGMFDMTVGDKQFLVEAPEEFVEPERLGYNIGSANWSHAVGSGSIFAVQGYDVIDNTGEEYVKVLDQWNKEKAESNPMTDLWMQVQHDNANNQVNLLVYKQNPDALDDRPQLNEDYSKITLKSTLDDSKSEEDLETLIEYVYSREMIERARSIYQETQDPELYKTMQLWGSNVANIAKYNPHLFELNEDTCEVITK